MSRVTWIDNAKAIAIVLVVLGHYAALNLHVKAVIYSFHLPLFMIISGFLLKEGFNNVRFTEFFNKQLRSFISLYIFFAIVSIFIWIGMKGGDLSDFYSALKAMLYGVHGAGKRYLHDNGALWYFPFLISSMLIFYFIMKLGKLAAIILSMLLFIVSYYYQGIRLPWSLDVAGIGVLSLLIGFYFKGIEQPVYYKLKSNKVYLFILTVVTFIILIFISSENGMTNINKNLFGDSLIFYILNMLLGSLFILSLSISIPQNKLCEFISKNTLIIFATHLFLVKGLRFLSKVDNSLLKHLLVFCSALLITFICAVLGHFLMPWIRKYLMFKPKVKE